jgi:MFS transporter, DHA1 family, inner membrane transport protein
MPLALWALCLSAFAIGTTEFVIVGLIPTIASSLHVSVPSAGALVSAYAIGVAIGAPILTALSGRLPRKTLLLALMALFTLGNLIAWHAPDYPTLMCARILTGLMHGVFFSIGSTLATSLVPREQGARAIAMMFSGLTVALVTGVPLGTWLGQAFGWQATFLAVALLGTLAFFGSLVLIPDNIAQPAASSLLAQCTVLARPRLLLVYAMTALGYGGTFTAFTFLAPLLEQVTGFRSAHVGLIMLAYGGSVAVGNVWGGRLADHKGPVRALQIIFAGLAAILLALTVTAHSPWLMVLTVLVWGAFAFGNVAGLQLYVVQQAERAAPHALDVASGLNIAAFNLGIACGAFVGGQIVQRMGLLSTPWVGALFVILAWLLTTWSGRLDRRHATLAASALATGKAC